MTDQSSASTEPWPAPVISVSPVWLAAPGRGEDLPVRISAPSVGSDLPVIVFAHGNGKSLDDYGPLVQFWAGNGFVVLQCTHLDSRRIALAADDPRKARIWRYRVEDLQRILDNLDTLLQIIPGLKGRVDPTRIGGVGHSFGGHTIGMMMGARILDDEGRPGESLTDPRIKAGVLLATAGRGGEDRTDLARMQLPYLNPDFSQMGTPALVVSGDHDVMSFLTSRGGDWGEDPYYLSPAPKALFRVFGGEHLLGGISGFEAKETTDENPARVAAVQKVTLAWLRQALSKDGVVGETDQAALMAAAGSAGVIECK